MPLFQPIAKKLLLIASLMVAMPVAQAAFPLDVQHRQGNLTLDEAPKRVAVFDLGVLDTLDALGVSAAGVPQMAGPAYLKAKYEGRGAANIGTLFEPDYAALQALKPDLIIIGGRSSAAYDQLSEVAPTIDLSIAPDQFLAGVYGNLQLLGALFDKEQRAAQLDAELKQALAALHGKSQGLSSLTLFTINDALMLHAPGERFGMLNEVLGTRAVVEAVAPSAQARPAPDSPEAKQLRERQKVRLEAALKEQPQWLVVLDRGAATGGEGKGPQTLANHAGIAAGSAYKNGQVFYLEPATWYIATGGYQGLMATLKDFSAAL